MDVAIKRLWFILGVSWATSTWTRRTLRVALRASASSIPLSVRALKATALTQSPPPSTEVSPYTPFHYGPFWLGQGLDGSFNSHQVMVDVCVLNEVWFLLLLSKGISK